MTLSEDQKIFEEYNSTCFVGAGLNDRLPATLGLGNRINEHTRIPQ
jgi:hypothetical protein